MCSCFLDAPVSSTTTIIIILLLLRHPFPLSLQRNGSLFGNHVNHVGGGGGDKQGCSQPTTVTQRPLQVLPFFGRISADPGQTERRDEDDSGGGGGALEGGSPSVQHNHHRHCGSPQPYVIPHCHPSPIPSNANLNNANVPSVLSMSNGRRQKCLLGPERPPAAAKNGLLACTYSRGVHSKPWKSHLAR